MEDRPVTTALFVDFDNIYSGLDKLDGASTAEHFATHPMKWLGWMQNGMQGDEEDAFPLHKRKILVRRCYLNPTRYYRQRADFIRAAFTVIDCPPITIQGKTSTDIHMVMDILDTLNHHTRFDEFIVLSGDSDFTPVLLRLRAYDRRTVIVSVGPAAEAYKAAADRVVDGSDFIEYALGFHPNSEERQPRPPSPVRVIRPKTEIAPPPSIVKPAEPETAAEAPPVPDAARDERLRAFVTGVIQDSAAPIQFPKLANMIRFQFPGDVSNGNWAGYSGFQNLLRALLPDAFATSDASAARSIVATPDGGGYLYDPARHAAPVAPPKPPVTPDDANAPPIIPGDGTDFATRINGLTGTPLLTSEQYAVLFSTVAKHLQENEFHLTRTPKEVRDLCAAAGSPIARSPITFVLQGCKFAGHRFSQSDTPRAVAEAFRKNVLNLCRDAQVELTASEEELLDRWLLGPPASTEAAVTEQNAEQPS